MFGSGCQGKHLGRDGRTDLHASQTDLATAVDFYHPLQYVASSSPVPLVSVARTHWAVVGAVVAPPHMASRPPEGEEEDLGEEHQAEVVANQVTQFCDHIGLAVWQASDRLLCDYMWFESPTSSM